MAQKQMVVTTSDLSGAEIAEGQGDTITFAVGRNSYVIDLTNDEVGAFYDALKPFTDVARSAGTVSTASPRSSRSSSNKKDLSAIREWASSNGYKVNTRGRIPGSVVEAYEAAN